MNIICITQFDYSLNSWLFIMWHRNRLKRTKKKKTHFSIRRMFLLCCIFFLFHLLTIYPWTTQVEQYSPSTGRRNIRTVLSLKWSRIRPYFHIIRPHINVNCSLSTTIITIKSVHIKNGIQISISDVYINEIKVGFVIVELDFSTMNRILTDLRNRLTTEHL